MKGSWVFVRLVFAVGLAALPGLVSGCNGGQTPPQFDPKEIALVRVEPADGESAFSRNRVVTMFFSTTVLPDSVNDQSIRIRTGGTFQTRPRGSFLISGNKVEFDPTVTEAGGLNAIGFEAGAQILLEVPLFIPGSQEPAVNFVQNVEGNPITLASGDNNISFTTGAGWDDPVPGPPGVLGLEFTPTANAAGAVPSNAAVTVIFNEPMDPASIVLRKNMFLTNNTSTAPIYQQDIPSTTFFDGSATRFTFLPVFGFGQGPFNILVNFIDPDAPNTFSPVNLPTDLAGNRVQNFTFFATFDTQFDPTTVNTGLITENFTSFATRDAPNTDALWGDDPAFSFQLVGRPITTRTQNANIAAFKAGGAVSDINNTVANTMPGEEDYCPTAYPLVGPDLVIGQGNPPTSAGRRQLNLYRQQELGGNGTVIRIAWGPDSDATFAATYGGFTMRIGHKRRATDLTPSSFFGQFDVDGFIKLVDNVSYTVPQAKNHGGGQINAAYVNWPKLDTFFDYNGDDELLLDIAAKEGNTFQTFRTFMAFSTIFGQCGCNAFPQCNPNTSTGQRQMDSTYDGDSPDPTPIPLTVTNPSAIVHVMQFEMAKLRSDAQSRYYNTLSTDPIYRAPIISPIVQSGGATVDITWSASRDGITEDVPFGPNISACDGRQYLRWHAVLRSNIFTSARGRVALIEVPFSFP